MLNYSKDVKSTLVDFKQRDYDLINSLERYEYAEEILKELSYNDAEENTVALKKLERVLGISTQYKRSIPVYKLIWGLQRKEPSWYSTEYQRALISNLKYTKERTQNELYSK